ncbi:transporter [Klebsiella pneumoniae]|uniref:Transporter n=1 Tax=Klebsiella pneumoniae TaxID=573 RepID=A0A3S4H1V5_KLEPN|nr:transporter [Klebsiella pneumoniae]
MVICGFMITWSQRPGLTISYHAYQAEVFPTPYSRPRRRPSATRSGRLSTAVTSILIGIILQYAGTPE